MPTPRSMRHVHTSRNVNAFRSCRHATGVSMAHPDAERIAREEARLAARQQRRLWLNEQWREHFAGAAGPLRVLPPSARSRHGGR